ncbi:DUF262 domain-containing protein [Ekhidna sp. MALMAid0563]|uniref:DUF262 domain-containing protein n=1 Tax=Ekhidna sp. MALMAid0563 TaxID=3143937 RepID=UPI0032DF3D11
MAELLLKDQDIIDIIKGHLKIEQKVMSIDNLFRNERLTSRIIYDPYYQRNYVWDKNKATYFIESILLGTEVPPLVFFDNGTKIEVIDGRQRFETIKRFLDKDFGLTKKGLFALTQLEKKNIDELGDDIKEIFWDTKIRLIEFSIVNEPRLDPIREDLIKKEIFRRYNSGITPLKKPEIERAKYITDDVTLFFKEQLQQGDSNRVFKLFFTDRDASGAERTIIEKVMSKVRQLITLHNIPIKRYSTLHGRDDILALFYEEVIQNSSLEESDIYESFIRKIGILEALNKNLDGLNDNNSRKLINECTFWALSILDKESKSYEDISFIEKADEYPEYIIEGQEKFSTENSHFYRNVNERYVYVAKYFQEKYDLNFALYLDDYTEFKENLQILNQLKDTDDILAELETLRLNKPEPSSMTIYGILKQMERNRFLLRPSYQRVEVINRAKSSALIESILLDIKLPPIFIFKRQDGVYEVVDGQQRLLSIIGFIGAEFKDENDSFVKSEKNKYNLSKLTILKELNGTKYESLDEKYQNKILDFNLSVVIIDSKLNPHFDPIDLFIRLNNKPYPIKENSFEMWNSYVDREVIDLIKTNTSSNSSWFHFKTSDYNSRMDNEELYTSLAYLEHEQDDKLDVILDIYAKGGNINIRIKDKSEITSLLQKVHVDNSEKEQFIVSINRLENFISTIKYILENSGSDDDLKAALNNLFNLKTQRRTIQSFYTLWYLLNGLNLDKLKADSDNCGRRIQELFAKMKSNETGSDEADSNQKVLNSYLDAVNDFKAMYK